MTFEKLLIYLYYFEKNVAMSARLTTLHLILLAHPPAAGTTGICCTLYKNGFDISLVILFPTELISLALTVPLNT